MHRTARWVLGWARNAIDDMLKAEARFPGPAAALISPGCSADASRTPSVQVAGEMFLFGDGDCGQLGMGEEVTERLRPFPLSLPGGKKVGGARWEGRCLGCTQRSLPNICASRAPAADSRSRCRPCTRNAASAPFACVHPGAASGVRRHAHCGAD